VLTKIYISSCAPMSFKIRMSLIQISRPPPEDHQRPPGAPYSLETSSIEQTHNWKPCLTTCVISETEGISVALYIKHFSTKFISVPVGTEIGYTKLVLIS
jgi:hypothetical protein